MARYTAESRERVRDAVDFAELVGARTELKRAGVRRLQGLCPFHEERTPSFGIDPVEKLYHCFGCGVGGDVFKFVMETEGLEFGEALESLAERYRVPLERETEDPNQAAERERRERLYGLLERTAAWYVRLLWESDEAAPAREYLAGRGLEEGALRAYRVGWAPAGWDRVINGSRRAGFSERELLAVGLAQPARGGAGLIDRFRGRITFPLTDLRGRVLGFGARAMSPEDRPKYLNTSESELFHKAQVVYGADLARAAAARAARVVVVEGYTDAIALHQAGVPEVVASMGTALTEAQISTIAKLAPLALFCQDPDTAGQESVARGIAALAAHNLKRRTRDVEFRIVRLPPGQDPADVAQRSGREELRALLDQAVEIQRFDVERALTNASATKDAILGDAARAIAPLPPSILRDDLVRLVSNRLAMREELVNEVMRAPAAVAAPPVAVERERAWLPEAEWRARRDAERGFSRGRRGDGGRRFSGPPPEPVDPHAALARREESELAYLALCVALPEEGEERLARADVDDYFSAPSTRQAARYLRGRLRAPAADLPPDDEPLARLVAKLVVTAGTLEATLAKLELEELQLDLHRLERHISEARLSGATGVSALAVQRQKVLDEIRHRLT
jgi:DNA primase